MNLLSILAEFRNAKPSDIEWHDEDRENFAYVRFQIHNKHEHYEVTIMDDGNGNANVFVQELMW